MEWAWTKIIGVGMDKNNWILTSETILVLAACS